ncbi:hypothetical protein M3914_003152 [Vibrio metschnikovii]|nr:hypothetical protein [Vibrio metschnikovii]
MESISQQVSQMLQCNDSPLCHVQVDVAKLVEEVCKVVYSEVTPRIMIHNLQNFETLAVNYCKNIFATEYPTWRKDYKNRIEQFNRLFKTSVCQSWTFYPLIFLALAKEWYFDNPEKLPPAGARLLELVDLDPQYWDLMTAPLIPTLIQMDTKLTVSKEKNDNKSLIEIESDSMAKRNGDFFGVTNQLKGELQSYRHQR